MKKIITFITGIILLLSLVISTDAANSDPFSDIERNKFKDSIIALHDLGVVNGYDDGTFKPNITVNRAEMTKIIFGAQTGEDIIGNLTNCFNDVKTDWYAPYVCYAKEEGIIQGYPDGLFRPAQDINVAEALKIGLEAFDVRLPNAGGEWYTPYTTFADQKGWFSAHSYPPYRLMTRGEMSFLIHQLLIERGDDVPDSNSTFVCGNRKLEGTEQCDDGNITNGDGCSSSCQLEAIGTGDDAICGNKLVEGAEECDDGNLVTETCQYNVQSCIVCSSVCQRVSSTATSYCGDGNLDLSNGEQCDDGNVNSDDGCSSICKTESTDEPDTATTDGQNSTSGEPDYYIANAVWPTESTRIADGFSPRRGESGTSTSEDFHRGLDIRDWHIGTKANIGDEVYAIADGIMIRRHMPDDPNNFSSQGGSAVIAHTPNRPVIAPTGATANEFAAYYLHLGSVDLSIQPGDTVQKGQVIGWIGDPDELPVNTSHLHFELRTGYSYQNNDGEWRFNENWGSDEEWDGHISPYYVLSYENNDDFYVWTPETAPNEIECEANSGRTAVCYAFPEHEGDIEKIVFTNASGQKKTINYNTREGIDPNDRDNFNGYNGLYVYDLDWTDNFTAQNGERVYVVKIEVSDSWNSVSATVSDIWGASKIVNF